VQSCRKLAPPGKDEITQRLQLGLVDFAHDRPVARAIITYMNRLSDWLFVMARLANKRAGVADIVWER